MNWNMSGRSNRKTRRAYMMRREDPPVAGGNPQGGGDPPANTPAGDPPAGDPPADPPKDSSEPPKELEPFVPLTAETVKLPEGFTVDEPTMTSFLEVMNDRELSAADRAQKLIDLQASVLTQASEANSKAWDELQETWKGEVKADPEIGGAKFDLTVSNISKLLDQYGSKETRDAFSLTGAGNNPHIVKFMSKLATQLTEGNPVLGNPGATSTTAAERMFPSMKKG